MTIGRVAFWGEPTAELILDDRPVRRARPGLRGRDLALTMLWPDWKVVRRRGGAGDRALLPRREMGGGDVCLDRDRIRQVGAGDWASAVRRTGAGE